MSQGNFHLTPDPEKANEFDSDQDTNPDVENILDQDNRVLDMVGENEVIFVARKTPSGTCQVLSLLVFSDKDKESKYFDVLKKPNGVKEFTLELQDEASAGVISLRSQDKSIFTSIDDVSKIKVKYFEKPGLWVLVNTEQAADSKRQAGEVDQWRAIVSNAICASVDAKLESAKEARAMQQAELPKVPEAPQGEPSKEKPARSSAPSKESDLASGTGEKEKEAASKNAPSKKKPSIPRSDISDSKAVEWRRLDAGLYQHLQQATSKKPKVVSRFFSAVRGSKSQPLNECAVIFKQIDKLYGDKVHPQSKTPNIDKLRAFMKLKIDKVVITEKEKKKLDKTEREKIEKKNNLFAMREKFKELLKQAAASKNSSYSDVCAYILRARGELW